MIADDAFTDAIRAAIGEHVDDSSLEAAYAVVALPELVAIRNLIATAWAFCNPDEDDYECVDARYDHLERATNDLPVAVRSWATEGTRT